MIGGAFVMQTCVQPSTGLRLFQIYMNLIATRSRGLYSLMLCILTSVFLRCVAFVCCRIFSNRKRDLHFSGPPDLQTSYLPTSRPPSRRSACEPARQTQRHTRTSLTSERMRISDISTRYTVHKLAWISTPTTHASYLSLRHSVQIVVRADVRTSIRDLKF